MVPPAKHDAWATDVAEAGIVQPHGDEQREAVQSADSQQPTPAQAAILGLGGLPAQSGPVRPSLASLAGLANDLPAQ